jgi:nicotinate-nucleotide--dimethylbenzimidazole phosphoribosyltransferase
MTETQSFPRPPTPPGFDPSRAHERAAEPRGWRYPEEQLAAVRRVLAERRDIRRFRPDAVPEDVLERILADAHRAPSVGLMQPWRLIVVRSLQTRRSVRALAQRERMRQAARFDARAREFLDQKIEGVVEAPLGICVCCDHGEPQAEILGRGTIPETDVYSTACAIENLWLSARAEGLGVGWVSFYRPADLRTLLGIPARADPIAYLCLGWPDERPLRPGLETAGWSKRMPLADVVMAERWQERPEPAQPREDTGAGAHTDAAERSTPVQRPAGTGADARTNAAERSIPARPPIAAGPADRAAVIAARDRLDRLVKPGGSLGALEALIERWAAIAGAPPPARLHAGVLICAADHGHTRHGTSLFGAPVSAQVAAAAARGETAAGVLARRGGHALLIADVGLHGATPPGVRACKVAAASADMTERAALTDEQLQRALAVGAALAGELLDAGAACLALGEIGIGNTATSAALASALLGLPPSLTVGRGTGMDAAGLERKRALVTQALELHAAAREPRQLLCALGGLELLALAGAILTAAARRAPVILDGYATAVAALAATRLDPLASDVLIASHRSAEPAHELILAELGLEPLLDLRMRLGEASGALLALPIIASAGALYAEMATFAEAGVEGPFAGRA